MKNILITLTFLIAATLLNAQSPTFQWAKNMGGYYGYSTGLSVAVDGSGNVYTTGYFEGKVDFDPGVGTFSLTSTGLNAAFVTKKDASGNFLWAKPFGGNSGGARGNSIAVNATGDIYVTGNFSDTVDFDPGAAVYNLTSAGNSDIFVMMLNASGNLMWARRFGSTWNDNAMAIAIDGSNNVYTVGDFSGNVDFDPGVGTFNLNTGGTSPNVFISKLNPGGNFVFAKHMSGSSSYGKSITIDLSGNIYTTGYFLNTVDFDPGTGIYNLLSSGSTDIFISKLSATGNFLWAKRFGGTEFDVANSIKTDGAGNVYTVGEFFGTIDFDPGPAVYNLTSAGYGDIFISKLDASGNNIWACRLGGATNSEDGNSVFSDGAGNICITGQFFGTVDFDPGSGIFNLTASDYGIFVLKLNSSGNFAWAKAMGATDDASGISITGDAAGNVYTTGFFREICDFDPGAGTSNLVALGGNFMFTSKLDASGNFVWAKSAGAGSSTFTKAMTTDLYGNVYTTGDFYGTVDFDPGPGIFNLSTAATDVNGDVFVTKCNSSGNLIWAKKLGGSAHDYANSIAVDASGNVYTAGSFKETADFNPGPGIYTLTSSSANYDIFISKLNASGNFVWAKKLGSTSTEDVYSIALDASGNLFTAGRYFPGTNSFQIYLNKLDPARNLAWSKIYGGPSADVANAIETDASGNIYITGYFSGTADLDPGTGIYNLTATGYNDAFVSKLDGAGNFIWAKQMGGSGYAGGSAITLDVAGNLHVTGTFNQTADFDPGLGTFNLTSVDLYDVFISKLENSGNFIWAKQLAGTGQDFVRSIAVDNSGNVYTTGTFSNADFDPGPGTFNLIAAGGIDIFVSKLDVSGNFNWALQIGSIQYEQVHSIALDGSSNIYIGGTFTRTVDFDPGPGIAYLTAHGSPDLFIHKMSQCIAPPALITPSGPTTFCSGGSVTLNANTGTGLTYQWQKNGVIITGATSSSYVATTSGSYTVFISNSLPCSETSNTIIVNVPCIPPNPNQERKGPYSETELKVIKVFPNPTTGIFVIDSPAGQLQIFNALGQQINTSYLQKNETTFDLSDFADGIYTLKLTTEESFYIKKIILNR